MDLGASLPNDLGKTRGISEARIELIRMIEEAIGKHMIKLSKSKH